MEDKEDRKNWKVRPINIAKAFNEIKDGDYVPYFLFSIFVDQKGLMGEFREFEKKIIETSKDLLNEEMMLKVQRANAIK